ncbi:hypothetical protein chiPu_0023571, partial [Chiloscyllium punctatum]|nr:hypothetical protein [Chiloscyllium punctatum]
MVVGGKRVGGSSVAMERTASYTGRGALLLSLLLLLEVGAQYEKYSLRSFPEQELLPLEPSYRYSLEQSAAGNWRESIRYLELSLRLHRLLRDSQLHCQRNCSLAPAAGLTLGHGSFSELRAFAQILQRAVCIKKCKRSLAVFKLPPPGKDTLEQFEKRLPYRYLENAYFQVGTL